MRSAPLPGASLAATLAYALGIVVPALLLADAGPVQLSPAAVAVYAIVAYAALRIAQVAATGAERIVLLTFWIFTYIFLGVCPLLQTSLGAFPLAGRYDDAVLVHAALVVLAGLLAFDAGGHLLGERLGAIAVPRLLRRPLRKPAIVLLAPVALAMTAVLLQRLGGWEALVLPRIERDELLADRFNSAEFAVLKHLARAPVYAVLMAGLVVWSFGRRNPALRAGPAWKALCAVLLVTTLVINNPISAPRLAVGTIALSLFFVLPWKRWYGPLCAVGLVAGLIFVFPLADSFRASLDAELGGRWANASAAQRLAQKMDFDAFQEIANAVVLVEREGVRYGAQVAGAALFWVPRSLWHGKPLATGQLLGEETGYDFTNLSAPLWAELYVDGGPLLVLAGFLFYGALVRTLDGWNRWGRARGDARVIAVLVPIYAGYQFFLLRGSLMPAVAYFTPILLFAMLCGVRLAPRLARRAAREAAPC